MPVVEKLDQQVELRFYRPDGLSSETIWARRTFRAVEYSPRSSAPTRLERVRFELHDREDMRAALVNIGETSPVRLFDSVLGLEYHVQSLETLPNRKRMLAVCQAFVPAQRTR